MHPTTTLAEKRAGYLAALLGLEQGENPHSPETETLAWHLWDEGYQAGCWADVTETVPE